MEGDFRLGPWVVSPKLNGLSCERKSLRLEPKVMQVLVCLAEAGEVVSKDRLMRTVWPDTFVTDDVLVRSISELRKAFDDDAKNPQFIQTIPKGGYRLLVAPTGFTADGRNASRTDSGAQSQARSQAPVKFNWYVRLVKFGAITVTLLFAVALGIYFSTKAVRARPAAALDKPM